MNFSALKNTKEPPILVIDKVGVIGEAISRHFSKENLIVLLSEKLFSKDSSNIIHVPFKTKIPQVPDNEYSKIFIVDDGSSVTRESAFSFIEKALENDAPLYFIGSIRNVDVEHADEITKSYDNSKVLLFGDLFDNLIVFDKNASINQFISSVRSDNEIEVIGNGLSLNFPITFADTVKLIIKATELEIKQKIILLFSANPITDLALANEFKKAKPIIKIESTKGKKEKRLYIPKGALHALDNYDLQKRIKSLDLDDDKRSKKTDTDKNLNNAKKRPSFFYLLISAAFILFLPLITTYALLFGGKIFLQSAEQSFSSGKASEASISASRSTLFLNMSKKTSRILDAELRPIKLSRISDVLSKEVLASKYLSEGLGELSSGASDFQTVFEGKTNSPTDLFSNALNRFERGMLLIEKSESLKKLPSSLRSAISSLGPVSDLVSNSPESLISILGFDSEKKYLVLGLDNEFMTPIGGRIKEMRVVHLNNGKITESKKVNLSDFGKYVGNPIDITFFASRYVGVNEPTIGESLYKLGFTKNAQDIMNIYSSFNSQDLDGVVALDSDDFEKFNSSTFFSNILKTGGGVISKKALFSVKDDDVQKVLDLQDWSGNILDNRSNDKTTLNDYFGIVQIGFDKKNNAANISKSVSKSLNIDSKGDISSSVTIPIKNNGKENYKTYLELLIPQDALLTEIRIDGASQKIVDAITDEKVYGAKNFKPPVGLEVETFIDSEKKVIGFPVNIPADGVVTITILYELPKSQIKSTDPINYSLSLYKQPGDFDFDVNLNFNLPDSYQLVNNSGGNDIYLDQDRIFTTTISQK